MVLKTNVAIVGAGAAGIAAALTLVDKKIDVILLEKGDKYGGAGMFGAQGLFAVGSKQQLAQADGNRYTLADAYQELMSYFHQQSNARLTKAILAKTADTIDWLKTHGLETELVNNTQEAHQKHARTYHQYIDKFNAFERMITYFTSEGGLLLTETAATKIIENDHKVTGIQVISKGKTEVIQCQAVIIADGGFIADPAMVQESLKIDPKTLYSMGERKATGDGIRMLGQMSADISQPRFFENHAASVVSQTNHKWHNQTIFSLTNLPLLWVDRTGRRFTNEDVCYDFALWGNTTYAAGGYYYFLLDQNLVDFLKNNHLDWTDAFERTFKTLQHEPMTKQVGPFQQIESDLAEAIREQTAVKADTLDLLAEQLQLPANNLHETITHYNQLIQQKQDIDFYKQDKFMTFPIARGPFYAIKARSTSLGTIGGVAVDETLSVLDKNKRVLPQLFAAGNTAAGGFYGDSYPTIEGLSCAFAWNSGRIAGESASQIFSQK